MNLGRVESALDIGCGIRPQRVVEARWQVFLDPHAPYLERVPGQTICATWEVIAQMPDRSFDVITALDVIEHLPRDEGWHFLEEARRVAGRVLIFTPDGPFPQHYDLGEPDQWGMDGGRWQTHRSSWRPSDFLAWEVTVIPDFHCTDADGRPLPRPIGAFWAISPA